MSRIVVKNADRGAAAGLRTLLSKNPELLNRHLRSAASLGRDAAVTWRSPVRDDEYAEYRDEDALRRLGLDTSAFRYPLSGFWPDKGPQWTGLAAVGHDAWFLVKAKASLDELLSDGTTGADQDKVRLVHDSLARARKGLGIARDGDWSGRFYQYANRLAWLHFLRSENRLPVWLVNIYLFNLADAKGPASADEWRGAIGMVESYLGCATHTLKKYCVDLFIDGKDLK